MKNENIEWSLYWAQDRLHSCVAAKQDVDQLALNRAWETFSFGLQNSAKVLDLATGNGAVPYVLLGSNNTLQVTAVDHADIAPLRYLSDKGLLESVEFVPNTDINELTFTSSTFDAITSQYGIEYAGLESAMMVVSPLLKPGGKLRFLIHHSDSEIIQSSQVKISEMSDIVRPDGLIDCLFAVLRGECDLNSLKQHMRAFQETKQPRSQQISGQLFDGISQVVSLMSSDPKGANRLGATMGMRVRAEHARLLQMMSAAQSEENIISLTKTLENENFQTVKYSAYYADDDSDRYLLGWVLDAQKRQDLGTA